MSLRFAANINLMFTEVQNLQDRIGAAKEAGFDAIESTLPFSVPSSVLGTELSKHDMQCTLLNAHSGDASRGDRGLAARPERKEEFKEKLELSIEYAKAMSCNKLHVMAGCVRTDDDIKVIEETYISNMKYAADRLEKEGIMLLVEFVNSRHLIPNYLVDTPEKAVWYVERIGHPNCKLQVDIFHLQHIYGDLTYHLEKYIPSAGYVQIAQVPGRGEPSCAGEINYDYILPLLRDLGYSDYIGLEYRPTGSTMNSLEWMKKWRV